MNVLHLIPSDGLGGAEQIAKRLYLGTLTDAQSSAILLRRQRSRQPTIHIRDVVDASEASWLRRVWTVSRSIRSERSTVIQSHGLGVLTAVAATWIAMRRQHIVVTIHKPEHTKKEIIALRIGCKMAKASGGCTVVGVSDRVTSAMRVAIANIPAITIENTPRTIHTSARWRAYVRKILDIGSEDILLVNVGNFRPEKRQRTLIESVQKIQQPSVCLALIGDGYVGCALEDDCGRVRLLGARRQVGAVLSAADGFVSASAYEGFGLALAEAVSVGLTTVACSGEVSGVVYTESEKVVELAVGLVAERKTRQAEVIGNAPAVDRMLLEYGKLYVEASRALVS